MERIELPCLAFSLSPSFQHACSALVFSFKPLLFSLIYVCVSPCILFFCLTCFAILYLEILPSWCARCTVVAEIESDISLLSNGLFKLVQGCLCAEHVAAAIEHRPVLSLVSVIPIPPWVCLCCGVLLPGHSLWTPAVHSLRCIMYHRAAHCWLLISFEGFSCTKLHWRVALTSEGFLWRDGNDVTYASAWLMKVYCLKAYFHEDLKTLVTEG